MNQNIVAELLQANTPIAICDGHPISVESTFELYVASFLQANNIVDFKMEGSLYTREKYDLSKYKTIIFDTQGETGDTEKFQKIVGSFSKEKLKLIIVGSDTAYFKVKEMAEKLGITIIYLNVWDAFGEHEQKREDWRNDPAAIDDCPEIKDIWKIMKEDVFWDPKEKFEK